jgi:hypothetical protein
MMISPAMIAGISVKATGLGPERMPILRPNPVSKTAPM